MPIRIAINGFGRIGRTVFRVIAERGRNPAPRSFPHRPGPSGIMEARDSDTVPGARGAPSPGGSGVPDGGVTGPSPAESARSGSEDAPALKASGSRPAIEVVAINDLMDPETFAYLLKYDTVRRLFPHDVRIEGRILHSAGQIVRLLGEKDPAKLPWKELGIDVVVEATGLFRSRKELQAQIEAGAGKVILTVPAKDDLDATVVLGVNDAMLRPEHRLVSNASCTTNCLAPVAKVLHESFGIEKGFMTTVHAYTNDQRLADVPHSDFRRSRAAAENIIPTTTGAARAVGEVLPALEGRLDGIAMRVPVLDGSTVDLVTEMNRAVTAEEVNAAIRDAARSSLEGILEYTEEPLVSSDVISNPHSSIFDACCTRVVGDRLLKTVAWYDNEWGYSCRVVDLIDRMAA